MSENLKKKRIKVREVLGPYQRTEKVMEHESDGDASSNWSTRNDPQRIGKETGRAKNRETSIDYLNYSITKVGNNTEKSPRDLRRLAVSQSPVRNYQLTLV